MDVTIIGCGYVGLVTGTCLAAIGHTVRGVEKDTKKLKTLMDGHCPIFEPGLQELMQEHYASGQLQFTDNVKAAVRDARRSRDGWRLRRGLFRRCRWRRNP